AAIRTAGFFLDEDNWVEAIEFWVDTWNKAARRVKSFIDAALAPGKAFGDLLYEIDRRINNALGITDIPKAVGTIEEGRRFARRFRRPSATSNTNVSTNVTVNVPPGMNPEQVGQSVAKEVDR